MRYHPNISRHAATRAILSGVIIVYLVIMLPITNHAEQSDHYNSLDIRILDPTGNHFLTASDVDHALDSLSARLAGIPRSDVNTLDIERRLAAHPRVEKARCLRLSNGTLRIEVSPMVPVARIFDSKGSAYVNAAGKRVPALPAYHVDVPIVQIDGTADSATVARLLPVLNAITANPQRNALVSAIRIDSIGDIILVPNILGHTINFGDNTDIDNKFDRLFTFYNKVMPARGWDFYENISLKWKGRIVATRASGNTAPRPGAEIVREQIVDETFETDGNVPPDSIPYNQ